MLGVKNRGERQKRLDTRERLPQVPAVAERMQEAGVSIYHPDALAALAAKGK
jgi:hypothetical protein